MKLNMNLTIVGYFLILRLFFFGNKKIFKLIQTFSTYFWHYFHYEGWIYVILIMVPLIRLWNIICCSAMWKQVVVWYGKTALKLATLPSSTHFHASVLIICISTCIYVYNTYTLQLVLFPLGVTQLLQFPN